MIRPVPYYRFFNPESTAIPKLYWDSYSQEQRIHALESEYCKIVAYLDAMSDQLNKVVEAVNAIEMQLPQLVKDTIEEDPAIQAAIMQAVNGYIDSQVRGRTYNELKQYGFLHPGA